MGGFDCLELEGSWSLSTEVQYVELLFNLSAESWLTESAEFISPNDFDYQDLGTLVQSVQFPHNSLYPGRLIAR